LTFISFSFLFLFLFSFFFLFFFFFSFSSPQVDSWNVRLCGRAIIWCRTIWSCLKSLLSCGTIQRSTSTGKINTNGLPFTLLHSVVMLKLSNCFWHPNIDVNLENQEGKSPFSLGCRCGAVSVVQVLLKDPRVDVTLDDYKGCTSLWWASWKGKRFSGSLQVAEILETSRTRKEKTGMVKDGKNTPPLKLQESTAEVKLRLCWRDSWSTQYWHVMNCGWSLECWISWLLRPSSTHHVFQTRLCISLSILWYYFQIAHGATDDPVLSRHWFN